jgi:hypothetical protein
MIDALGLDAAVNLLDPADRMHPLNRGLVAWWLALPGLMGGPRWRDLIGTNDGVLTNGPVWKPTTRPGGWGCLSFDGTDDRVQVPTAPALAQVGTGDFYISFWLFVRSAPSQYDTIASTYGGGGGYTIISFRIFSNTLNILLNTGLYLDAPVTVTVGAWEWWLFGRDGSNLVASRNGETPATVGGGSGDVSTNYGWTIGNESGGVFGDRVPDMLLDDVRVGTTRPTTAFMRSLYDLSRRGYPSC